MFDRDFFIYAASLFNFIYIFLMFSNLLKINILRKTQGLLSVIAIIGYEQEIKRITIFRIIPLSCFIAYLLFK